VELESRALLYIICSEALIGRLARLMSKINTVTRSPDADSRSLNQYAVTAQCGILCNHYTRPASPLPSC
jgi:hypothetical protein